MRQLRRFRAPGFEVVALALLVDGCAYPVVRTAVDVGPPKSVSTPVVPIVQVRSYNVSPTLTVVAWMDDAESYGLRIALPRNGDSLSARSRQSDHELYVATTAIVEGAVRRASLGSRELMLSGVRRDAKPCDGGRCLPPVTVGVLIPDVVLRGYRDTAVVELITPSNAQLDVVLPRELIVGYLKVVDSVAASLKSRVATTH